MHTESHSPARLAVTFDDDRAVAGAGLALVATLSERLEMFALANASIDLGGRPGHALPGRKVATLVHAMVAGAECIDDCDVLRSGSTGDVLGHDVMAPSTLGTFLRAFTFGHVRQLDALSEGLLARAWAFGAGACGCRKLDSADEQGPCISSQTASYLWWYQDEHPDP